ncbi:hypothetical protein [Algoriphagus boritolerans]|uniref:hypothetical protein n=1 Tax=Algoriphagus boritolerans TaxID=308111 RepID=UPI002FCE09C8
MKYGAVQRGLLGVRIQDVSPDLEDALDIKFPVEQGVYVGEVNENSAGEEAGLKKRRYHHWYRWQEGQQCGQSSGIGSEETSGRQS